MRRRNGREGDESGRKAKRTGEETRAYIQSDVRQRTRKKGRREKVEGRTEKDRTRGREN